MEEENKRRKTREDFETDSEWYTYDITHPEENVESGEDKNDESLSKPYPLIIVMCQKCGYIIDENELKPLPDENVPYEKRLECPKCHGRKFKQIKNKEEKDKILAERKRKEEKQNAEKVNFIKKTIAKLQIDIEELKEELDEELKNKKITPERYCALLINLTYNIYKYYRNDERMSLFYRVFYDFAHDTAVDKISSYYEGKNAEDALDALLADYNEVKDFDMIYLKKSLEYASESEIVAASSDISMNELEIKQDIKILEYKIDSQTKYNERLQEILDLDLERRNDIDEKFLFKELRRINGV